MDRNVPYSNRSSAGIDILRSIIGGTLIGIAAFFLKLGLDSSTLSPDVSIILLILNPLIILTAILSLSGFFIIQKAMHKGHVSVVAPVSSGLGIIVPILLAYVFLGEIIVFEKGFGIVLIVIGISILGRKE